MEINFIGLLASFLHIFLLVVVYFLIPKLVAPDKQEQTKHWVLASFSAIFLILIGISVKDKLNIFIIFIIGAIVISGILWWVPTYIPEEDQDLASHILIVASSVLITIVSTIFSLHDTEVLGIQETSTFGEIVGGKRRRRHR